MKAQNSDTPMLENAVKASSQSLKEKSKLISGAEAVIKCLLEEGVDTIFGYPGGAIMPVYDSLYFYQDKIQHILPRHEQGAIHAAQGYARVTRNTGVCMATSGPGATNFGNGDWVMPFWIQLLSFASLGRYLVIC